jgi:hypothetical protein
MPSVRSPWCSSDFETTRTTNCCSPSARLSAEGSGLTRCRLQYTDLSRTFDGLTFTIQNQGLNAVAGGIGGTLGYQGIAPSIAVKFDTFNNDGEGVNSTGLYTNGAAPTVPAIDLTPSGIDLHSGDTMHAHLTYDGTTLTLTLTDTVTGATFTAPFTINIPSTVGGNTAFVGFTAATGGTTSAQDILNWTYTTN